MPTTFSFEAASTLLEFVFIAYLVWIGLWKHYKWLMLMLAIGLLRDLWLNRLDADTESYQRIWACTLVPYLCVQVLCGAGAYFKLAQLYQGMGRFAGWLYFASVLLAEVLFFGFHHWAKDSLYALFISRCFDAEQSIAVINTGAIVLVALFLWRFPRPLEKLPRNIIRHLSAMTVFFGLTAVFQIVMSSMEDQSAIRVVERVFFALGDLCYLGWMLMLRKGGDAGEEWPCLEASIVEEIRVLDQSAVEVAGQLNSVKLAFH